MNPQHLYFLKEKQGMKGNNEHLGRIVFFNVIKGYGFLHDFETNNRYFFHYTGLVDEVTDGAHITFELDEFKGKPVAVNVKLKT